MMNIADLIAALPVPNQVVVEVPENSEFDFVEDVDHSQKIVRDLLFISDWQRKNQSSRFSELLILDDIKSPPNEDIHTNFSVSMASFNRHHFGHDQNPWAINPSAYAKSKLADYFPFIDDLSFDGYVLAGGSVLTCIRRPVRNATVIGAVNDFDFFIVADHGSIVERHSRAVEISNRLFTEFKEIWENKLKDTHRFSWLKNENCLTVYYNALNTRRHSTYKMQIIFRAYREKNEVLLGFDLPQCQWLYDGLFKTTPAGYMAAIYNICVIDVKRCSISMTYRVLKYHCKNFICVFPGASRESVLEITRQRPRKIYQFFIFNYMHMPADNIDRYYLSGVDNERVENFDQPLPQKAFKEDDDAHTPIHFSLNAISDYDDEEVSMTAASHNNIDNSLSKLNFNQFMKGMIFYLGGRENDSPFDVMEPYRSIPFYVAKMALHLLATISDLRRIMSLFGEMGSAAALEIMSLKSTFPQLEKGADRAIDRVLYHNNPLDWHIHIIKEFPFLEKYVEIILLRAKEIERIIHEKLERIQVVSWRMTDPSEQDYGSFNPVDMNARRFYSVPEIYNPNTGLYENWPDDRVVWNRYHITWLWAQKMTIIRALRNRKDEPDCLLVQMLPSSLIKYIFNILDQFKVIHILNRFR